jgi:hypothetical protein
MDEIAQFDLKYIKAVYGDDFGAQAQQLAAAFALYPSIQPMMARMSAEGGKLKGTSLDTTTVLESVKSAEQMKTAQDQQSSAGGGLTGKLAGKMMGGPPKPRSTVFTTTHNVLSIEAAATADDVAIPPGFKEKK